MTHNEQIAKDVTELQTIKDTIRQIADKYVDRNQKRTAGLLDAACACIERAQVEIL